MPVARAQKGLKRAQAAYKDALIASEQQQELQQTKFQCTFSGCPKLVSREADLKRHMDVHDESTKNKYKCPVGGCTHTSRQKSNLVNHIKNKHGLEEIPEIHESEEYLAEMAFRRYSTNPAHHVAQPSTSFQTAGIIVWDLAPSAAYPTQHSRAKNPEEYRSYTSIASSLRLGSLERSVSPFDYHTPPSPTPELEDSYYTSTSRESSPADTVYYIRLPTPSPRSSPYPEPAYPSQSFDASKFTLDQMLETDFTTSHVELWQGYTLEQPNTSPLVPAFDSKLPYQESYAPQINTAEVYPTQPIFADESSSYQTVSAEFPTQSMNSYQGAYTGMPYDWLDFPQTSQFKNTNFEYSYDQLSF